MNPMWAVLRSNVPVLGEQRNILMCTYTLQLPYNCCFCVYVFDGSSSALCVCVFLNTTLLPSFEWVLTEGFITVDVFSGSKSAPWLYNTSFSVCHAAAEWERDCSRGTSVVTYLPGCLCDLDDCQWRCFGHTAARSWLSSSRLRVSFALCSPVIVSQSCLNPSSVNGCVSMWLSLGSLVLVYFLSVMCQTEVVLIFL